MSRSQNAMEKDPVILTNKDGTDDDNDHHPDVELTSLLPSVPDGNNGACKKDVDVTCSASGDAPSQSTSDVKLDIFRNCSEVYSIQDGARSRSGSTSVRFDDILIEVINATTIHVDWTPLTNSNDIHGYKIRYSVKENSSYNEVFVTPVVTSYTICGLKPNTDYDVTVNAVDQYENVVWQCGSVSQRTDSEDDGSQSSSPFIPILIAGGLLLTAVTVPVTILLLTYSRAKSFDAPYITAIVGATLLLLAAVVPITFLFLRNCGKCAATSASGVISGDTVTSKETDLANHSISSTAYPLFTHLVYKIPTSRTSSAGPGQVQAPRKRHTPQETEFKQRARHQKIMAFQPRKKQKPKQNRYLNSVY